MTARQIADHRRAESAARAAGLLRPVGRLTADDVLASLREAGARSGHADPHLVVAVGPGGEQLFAELASIGEWALRGTWRGRDLTGFTVADRRVLASLLIPVTAEPV